MSPALAAAPGAPPRKKMATYGKAVRRRIPDYSFTPVATKSQKPEVQIGKDNSNPSKASSIDSASLRTTPQRSRPSTPSAPSPARTLDIFDVPSSDDEDNLTIVESVAKGKSKATANRVSKRSSPKQSQEVSSASVEDVKSSKRAKLSPAPKFPVKAFPEKVLPMKVMPAKTSSSHTLTTQKTSTTPGKKRLQGVGYMTTVVARPKQEIQHDVASTSRTSRMTTPKLIQVLQDDTPSSHSSDIEMMDVDEPTGGQTSATLHGDTSPRRVPHKSLQSLKGLVNAAEDSQSSREAKQGQSPRSKLTTSNSQFKASRISKPTHNNRPKPPRRRLIDSLVEQRVESEDVDGSDSEKDSTGLMLDATPPTCTDQFSMTRSLAPEELFAVPTVPSSQSSQSQIQTTGPRVTYSRQRSMLAEVDLMEQLALDMPVAASGPQGPKPRRGSIPKIPQLPSYHEDVEEAEGSGPAILNVHELRQAGANSRFLDEIDDLLDRIGRPGGAQVSLRRSGLLDMAIQLKDKNFARQFRSNHVEQRLFLHLGQETDIIAGYVLVSILMIVLVDGSVPPFVTQLRRQGVTRLLIRLLGIEAGVLTMAKDRKSNTTKIAQKMITEHHDHLLTLPIWEELQMEVLSPRTVALKCLELMVRQTREAGDGGDIFSKELTTTLFTVMKHASDSTAWDYPVGREANHFYLALSALESHSLRARTISDENIWLVEYLPIIADTLQAALLQPLDRFGVLQVLTLRLTLNVTNNNQRASDVFARGDLMDAMGQVIVAKFQQISRFMIEEELLVVVDHLVLVLGAMINFAEWSSAARNSIQRSDGDGQDHLASMIKIFTDNHERMSEVKLIP